MVMQTTEYIVYWSEQNDFVWSASSLIFYDDISVVLSFMEKLRKSTDRCIKGICMSSEISNSVGLRGVDCIKDGVCPDGVVYDWVKRREVTDVHKKIVNNFIEFAKKLKNNEWWYTPSEFKDHQFSSIYCRYAMHRVVNKDSLIRTFDIANIDLHDMKGKGVLTAILDILENTKLVRAEYIYIENVLEKRFQEYFKRRGYRCSSDPRHVSPSEFDPPSFWKAIR